MSTASSMHLVLVDSRPSTPNVDSTQNENGAEVEIVKQTGTGTDHSDHISDSKNTPKSTPKVTPKGTPTGTPRDTPRNTPRNTPKGSPNGTPKGTPKGTPRREVMIGNKTTENSTTDNVIIYNWESSKQTAELSCESDQSYDVHIPNVPSSSSNSDNDQNTSNEDPSEYPPALTIDSDSHDEIYTNQTDHLGKFYIKSQSIYVFATKSLANHYLNITGKGFILIDCYRDILVSRYQSFYCKCCVCYLKREQFK